MSRNAVIGLILIVIGVVALVYQGITYSTRETVLDVGPIHATADREKTLPISPLVGAGAVAGGVALLLFGLRSVGGEKR